MIIKQNRERYYLKGIYPIKKATQIAKKIRKNTGCKYQIQKSQIPGIYELWVNKKGKYY